MNTLSNILDALYCAIGLPIPTACNGARMLVWIVLMAFAAAVYFRRWSWLAICAAPILGFGANLLRVALLLPLAHLPCFHIVHEVAGWLLSGLAILIVVECVDPTREAAVWISRGLCALLIVWAVLLTASHAFPGPTGRVTDSETFCPKNPWNFLEGKTE